MRILAITASTERESNSFSASVLASESHDQKSREKRGERRQRELEAEAEANEHRSSDETLQGGAERAHAVHIPRNEALAVRPDTGENVAPAQRPTVDGKTRHDNTGR